MKIAVASKKQVKLNAAKAAFQLYFGDDSSVEITGRQTESGVNDQPMDAHETARGARNRALAMCKAMPDADYAVGIEGGLSFVTIDDQEYAFEQK
jgi:inosine/xanthosine triphosphatase